MDKDENGYVVYDNGEKAPDESGEGLGMSPDGGANEDTEDENGDDLSVPSPDNM